MRIGLQWYYRYGQHAHLKRWLPAEAFLKDHQKIHRCVRQMRGVPWLQQRYRKGYQNEDRVAQVPNLRRIKNCTGTYKDFRGQEKRPKKKGKAVST